MSGEDKEEMMKSMFSMLNVSSEEELVDKMNNMSPTELMSAVSKGVSSGRHENVKISLVDVIKRQMKSKDDVPLAKIRDGVNGNRFFNNDFCCGCGKPAKECSPGGGPLKRCNQCKAVMYCSRECQVRDWKGNGVGPTAPQKHKDLCPHLIQANQQFQTNPIIGQRLIKQVFSSWADQHHKSGSFFEPEFLIRKGLMGGESVGYWARPDTVSPYLTRGKDCKGFRNGQMLLRPEFPTTSQGWTSALKQDEYPSAGPPESGPPFMGRGLRVWEEYMEFRNLKCTSVAPLLLTNVMTVYQMIFHILDLPHIKKDIQVVFLGAETELNQIPLFGELAYLLPGIDLELIWVSPATKDLCDEARKRKYSKSILGRALGGKNKNLATVLDVTDPVGHGRVRITLHTTAEYMHDKAYYNDAEMTTPDAALALNAGLGAYNETWDLTMTAILLTLKIPFVVSDQTVVSMRHYEVLLIPSIVNMTNRRLLMSSDPRFRISLPMPEMFVTLNPYHGIIARDVGAVRVPNIKNCYILAILPR